VADVVREILDAAMTRLKRELILSPEEMTALMNCMDSTEREIKRMRGGEQVKIRKPERIDKKKVEQVRSDYLNPDLEPHQVAEKHGISRATLYRYIKR
jgi:transcriptional regulator of acetoin/glycerol metabolism